MNLQKTVFLSRQIGALFRRNIGMSAIIFNQAQQMDPIQKLFLDQVVSYANQSKKLGGGPVDAGANYQKLKDETVSRLKKVYGVTDPKAFPEMKFTEPDLDQDSIEDL